MRSYDQSELRGRGDFRGQPNYRYVQRSANARTAPYQRVSTVLEVLTTSGKVKIKMFVSIHGWCKAIRISEPLILARTPIMDAMGSATQQQLQEEKEIFGKAAPISIITSIQCSKRNLLRFSSTKERSSGNFNSAFRVLEVYGRE